MRPTGRLHLGNLHGALIKWIELQDQGDYDCFYFVADWHALTSEYRDTGQIRDYAHDMVIDWLSAGLNPAKSTLFVQSAVREHVELFCILSMITPLAWLESGDDPAPAILRTHRRIGRRQQFVSGTRDEAGGLRPSHRNGWASGGDSGVDPWCSPPSPFAQKRVPNVKSTVFVSSFLFFLRT
jgi:tryptophanyl-tRNA synthetase